MLVEVARGDGGGGVMCFLTNQLTNLSETEIGTRAWEMERRITYWREFGELRREKTHGTEIGRKAGEIERRKTHGRELGGEWGKLKEGSHRNKYGVRRGENGEKEKVWERIRRRAGELDRRKILKRELEREGGGGGGGGDRKTENTLERIGKGCRGNGEKENAWERIKRRAGEMEFERRKTHGREIRRRADGR